MTEISAKVIADSIWHTHRLTTIEVTFARFVLAEMNTHRVFSRNSASSRAIPARKQIRRVVDDPFVPLVWASERPGMQGGDELTGWRRSAAKVAWRSASLGAAGMARAMAGLGVHKSIANRVLEPFCWHTAIISSTEWANFFAQRVSPLAQPEMRAAAEAILSAYQGSVAVPLSHGDWHLPYISDDELVDLGPEVARKVSVARCARVSYLTHDGRRDVAADLELYKRLVSASPPHASPLEHVATPCDCRELSTGHPHRGNFDGWDQLRHRVLQ